MSQHNFSSRVISCNDVFYYFVSLTSLKIFFSRRHVIELSLSRDFLTKVYDFSLYCRGWRRACGVDVEGVDCWHFIPIHMWYACIYVFTYPHKYQCLLCTLFCLSQVDSRRQEYLCFVHLHFKQMEVKFELRSSFFYSVSKMCLICILLWFNGGEIISIYRPWCNFLNHLWTFTVKVKSCRVQRRNENVRSKFKTNVSVYWRKCWRMMIINIVLTVMRKVCVAIILCRLYRILILIKYVWLGPRWASWNIGIFLCIRCAGIHRKLGVHISKVKSVNLDTWTPQQVVVRFLWLSNSFRSDAIYNVWLILNRLQCLQQMGNSRARAVYEANLPDNFRRPQSEGNLESFIRAKYEHKKFIAREWVAPALPKVSYNDSSIYVTVYVLIVIVILGKLG